MKFFKIIYINLLLVSPIMVAQNEETIDSTAAEITNLGIGIKAGFNFATVSRGDFKKAPDARSNFYFGVNYEIPIIEGIFSLQPEIIYSRQGFEKKYTALEKRYTSKYYVDYISVPIIARYYVVRGFSLEAGPQVSYSVSKNFERDEITDTERLKTSDVNNVDFSFLIGLTFQFESGFFIGGRYNRSFNEIIKDSQAKNTVIQLGLGYKF